MGGSTVLCVDLSATNPVTPPGPQCCTKYEQAWQEEDFGYKEYHENNEIAGAHTSGEKKRAARFCNKSAKKKTKSEKMKCINLSSDEEDEGEFELDDKVQIVSELIRRGVGEARV